MSEILRITAMLKSVFDGPAWHGDSIRRTLSQINEANKNSRVGTGHSVIELVGHMTAWRKYVTSRLAGDYSFSVDDSLNFPKQQDLPAALQSLEESQHALIKALEKIRDDRLEEPVPEKDITYYTLIHGLIQHDVYHQGQISMILKSLH